MYWDLSIIFSLFAALLLGILLSVLERQTFQYLHFLCEFRVLPGIFNKIKLKLSKYSVVNPKLINRWERSVKKQSEVSNNPRVLSFVTYILI